MVNNMLTHVCSTLFIDFSDIRGILIRDNNNGTGKFIKLIYPDGRSVDIVDYEEVNAMFAYLRKEFPTFESPKKTRKGTNPTNPYRRYSDGYGNQ